MLTDAVASSPMWKKWPEWFLITGSNPADKLLADAYRTSAAKFGAEIVEERESTRIRAAPGGPIRAMSSCSGRSRVFTQDAEGA